MAEAWAEATEPARRWPSPEALTDSTQPLWQRVRDRLDSWRRIGASKTVVRWLEHGVPVPLTEPVPNFDHGAIPLTPAHQHYWTTVLEPHYISTGAIRTIPEEQAKHVSRAFLVDKIPIAGPVTEFRLVVDLFEVNQRTEARPFRFDTLAKLSAHTRRHDVFIKFDLSDAYHHVALQEAHRHLFQFRVGSQVYECIGLPFGWKCSPFYFAKIAKQVVKHLRGQHLRDVMRGAGHGRGRVTIHSHRFVLNYLDDFIGVTRTLRAGRRLASEAKNLLTRLGLLWKEKKCTWVPSHCIEALGVQVNSALGTFTLPERRRKSILGSAQQLLQLALKSRRWVNKRKLARLCGKAQSGALAIRYARHRLQNLYSCLKKADGWHHTTKVQLSHQAMKELRWWCKRTNVSSAGPIHTPAYAATLTTDASNTGWGATLEIATKKYVAQGFWNSKHLYSHITLKELMAVRLAVESFIKLIWQSVVKLRCDAQVVVWALMDMTARSPALRRELDTLVQILESNNTILLAEHLPGHLNVAADALSRAANQEDWQLDPNLISMAEHHWSLDLDTDRFASANNRVRERFFAATYQPGACGVDAFSAPLQDWLQHPSWMNPPWTLLDKVVRFLQDHPGVHGVLATPHWPGEAWFAPLLARCDEWWLIRSRHGLFTSGRQQHLGPAPAPPWDVVLWKV